MRFVKPSFKTKNSSTAVISPTGKYLAQFGKRISIWDIEKGEFAFEHKVIKHDSYIGFSNDEKLMFSKNTNGEIVFFDTSTGEKVSSSGEFHHYAEGSQPLFSKNCKKLFDPSWKEGLKVWSSQSCEITDQYEFGGWGLSCLVRMPNSNLYAVSTSSKQPFVGHSKLYLFEDKPNNLKFEEIKLKDNKLKNGDN